MERLLDQKEKSNYASTLRHLMWLVLIFKMAGSYAQAPVISYASPKSYMQGVAMSLTPTASGVAAFGYSNTYVTIPHVGVNTPGGLVFDSDGNLFVTDGNRIAEIPNGGTAAIFYGPAFTGLNAIAIDAGNNLYVTDFKAHALYKIPAGGGSAITLSTGFQYPNGVAVDRQGNIYVIDNASGNLWKFPASGGAGAILTTYPAYRLNGITVDAAGNIYLSDEDFTQSVLKIPAGGGAAVTVATGYQFSGLVPDNLGNVFVCSGEFLDMIPAGSSSTVQISPNLFAPEDVTMDKYGSLYVSEIALQNNANTGRIKKINRTGGYFISPVLPQGLQFNEHTGVISGTPTVASPATDYIITAYNSHGRSSAVVSLKIVGTSRDADLSQLKLNAGVLSPAFSPGTTSYTASVVNGVHSLVLTPITASSQAKVTINGMAVADGAASPAIHLAAGVNTIHVKVTAPDGITTKTYALTVNRPATSNDNLSSIKLSRGVLSPAFTEATTSYTASVANAIRTITITPTAADQDATIKVNGVALTQPASGLGLPSAVDTLLAGVNTINITVTASDGTTSKTYTLKVTRKYSGNANLSNLVTNQPGFPVFFEPTTTSYSLTVLYQDSTITVTPTAARPFSTIKVNGTTVASGATSGTIPLAVGANTVSIVVTAKDGVDIKIYTLSINRIGPVNAYLSAVGTSPATPFSAVVNVNSTAVNGPVFPFADSVVTVTPTASDPGATITVNGIVVPSGSASGPIALALGQDNVDIHVTASDGLSSRDYTLGLFRATVFESNADLSGLTPEGGTISPAFNPDTLNYTDTVAYNLSSTYLNYPVAGFALAYVTGPGVSYTSSGTLLNIAIGTNVFTITVKASYTGATKVYTLTIFRPVSSDHNDNLSSIGASPGTLSPAFSPAITNYTLNEPNTVSLITLNPIASDAGATLKIDNNIIVTNPGFAFSFFLSEGSHVFHFTVTAPDGTTVKVYTLTVIRAPSTNANLAGIVTSSGKLSPGFSPATTTYTLAVANADAALTVTPTTAVNSSTVKINGTPVASEFASGPIPLTVGSNTINIVVTAQDSVTTKTYTLTVTRAAGPINIPDESVAVAAPNEKPSIEDDVILVHQGISPNGDGISDYLVIDGIQAYPDNKLAIMNRNGALVFETKGYDNASKVFDGHSNKTGQMQLPGTYFYSLEYTVKGIIKHKTGYLVLKY